MAGTVTKDFISNLPVYTPEDSPPFKPDWHPSNTAVDFPSGTSGVFKGKVFARKVFNLASPTEQKLFEEDKGQFKSELKHLSHAQHLHVIRLDYAYIFKSNDPKFTTHAAIIMERVDNFPTQLKDPQLKYMQQCFRCLANAVSYIHGIGIRHRDIKPDNILVKNKKVLLADFGISKMVLGKTLSTTKAGDAFRGRTVTHCAPEVDDGGTRSRSADIFSLGAVFLDMLAALTPQRRAGLDNALMFRQSGGNTSYAKNLERVQKFIDEWRTVSHGWCANLLSLCQEMLHEDADIRPDAFKVADEISRCGLPSSPCECALPPPALDAKLLFLCRSSPEEEVRDLVCSEGLKDTPGAIHQASAHGRLDIVKVLLKQDFNVNLLDYSGQTALHSAAGYGKEEIIEYLLLQQADATIQDSDGRTALHYAAGHGELTILCKMLSAWMGGLEAEDKDGRTPLHFAASRGHLEVIQELFKRGANMNKPDKTSRTALHLAAGYGSLQAVQLLLENGADFKLKTKDEKRWTALHFAVNGIQRRGQYRDVISLLVKQKMPPFMYGDLGCGEETCECDPSGRQILVCDVLRKSVRFHENIYFSRGRAFVSATTARSRSQAPSDSLISFLATAQMRNIDFLPTTWEADLDGTRGGTSKIGQSFLNLKLSYVFKRIKRDEVDEAYAFHALSSEVFILGHRGIRGHENIVRLMGICWDVVSAGEPIWPVLVFQKSHHGDLKQFMESTAGLGLDLSPRMKLCTDIAAAIVLMHSYGIVHGDIKPENVLIFDEGNGYTAKVSDFGYSVLSEANPNEQRIHLPVSIPWNAREVIDPDRLFSLHQAKFTDIYSFGLLCLWLLFPKSRDDFSRIRDQRSDLKYKVQLLDTVTSLIESTAELDISTKTGLKVFFASTLANDPNERSLDLKEIMRPFAEFEVPPLPNQGFSNYEMWIPYLKWVPQHRGFDAAAFQAEYYNKLGQYYAGDSDPGGTSLHNPYSESLKVTSVKPPFQLSKSFEQFMRGDFRLWGHIFKSLKDRVSDPPATQEDEHIAFQLAFCYEVGFGVERSESETQSWLKKSKRNEADLRSEIANLKANKNPFLYKNLETEINVAMDYMSHYQQINTLADVERAYEAAVSNSERIFDKDHPISIFLNRQLGSIYQVRGDYGKALDIFESVASTCEKYFGPQHSETLTTLSSVAVCHLFQGQLGLAENLELRIMDGLGKKHSEDTSSMVTNMKILASIYKQEGRWDVAESLELKIFQAYETTMGADHRDTLEAMVDLVLNYKTQGQSSKAEDFGLRLLERTAKIAGKEFEGVADAMDALSSIYESQERWKAMAGMAEQATNIRKRILGPEHQNTLLSILTLATAYSNQGRLDEAAEIQTEVVKTAKRVFGVDDTNTLVAMHNLAYILKKSNRDQEAISLMKEVASARERLLGKSHPLTVSSVDALLVFRRLAGEEVDQRSLDRILTSE